MTATLASVVWVIGLVVVIAGALGAVALRRRSTSTSQPAPVVTAPPPVDAPMVGLESALSQVTDRSGRPLREYIDAEQQHVDDLRVPDDTGPLLRRALDHVEQPGPARDETAITPTNDAI